MALQVTPGETREPTAPGLQASEGRARRFLPHDGWSHLQETSRPGESKETESRLGGGGPGAGGQEGGV